MSNQSFKEWQKSQPVILTQMKLLEVDPDDRVSDSRLCISCIAVLVVIAAAVYAYLRWSI